MDILITGGCGFIGHHIVEHFLKNSDFQIIVLDKLNYASFGFQRLRDISCYNTKRVKTITADFTLPLSEGVIKEIGDLDYIIHLGAETHVDNSITNPEPFVMANVLGTMRMLDFARKKDLRKFVYFSTDEVFGPAPQGTLFREWDRYHSGNPYSASKAGGEELCLAYANTYKLPVLITHTMNAFGERQHPEKFIPLVISKVLNGETVTIHSNPEKTKAGSRFYIHCRNIASAIDFLLKNGKVDKYNIVGEKEVNNLELAQFISRVVGKPLKYEMVDFHSSRPGHDLRYALDGTKMKKMGWRLPLTFEDSLEKTIKWTLNHKNWI
jgi:dTDP-glucose 4,6-dehydratase